VPLPPDPRQITAQIAMAAVLDSCEQELDRAELQQWLEAYFRDLHGITFDDADVLFDLLAQSRRITRGSATIADRHITPTLHLMLNHTLAAGHEPRRAVNWVKCLRICRFDANCRAETRPQPCRPTG
jgi:hypothetical protein